MDWIESSKEIFAVKKPINFGNYNHCSECAEYNDLLKRLDVNTITSDDVLEGNDPFYFSSDEGMKYYMPALIRFCFEEDHFFFCQLIHHLEKDGKDNSLILSCNQEQRDFICSFVAYFIDNYPEKIEQNLCDFNVLKVYDIWTST